MQNKVTEQISLDPLTNKTGDVWHVFLKGDFKDMLYGYKFDGIFSPEEGHYYNSSTILLDPYAKVMACMSFLNCWVFFGCVFPLNSFNIDLFISIYFFY
jgi:isoamylase